MYCKGSAAAAATAVIAVGILITVSAGALILTAAAVILLYEQEYKNKNQNPCAGIAAEETSVIAAHFVLPPFSDFTIYYAAALQSVKNEISGEYKSLSEF